MGCCGKPALWKPGMCGGHGGGARCEVTGRGSMALGKSAMCGEHGGGQRCRGYESTNAARNKTGKYQKHTRKTKAEHRTSDEAEPQVTDAGSILSTKFIHAPSAYKAGCTMDASAARMCGGVAAATGISGTGGGPVGIVSLPMPISQSQ